MHYIGHTTAALAFGGIKCSTPSRKPNILFLLADDQRNDMLGCAGHPILKTPAIDSLAAGGARFVNAFVTTAICAASRASILTGLYECTHGYTFGTPPLSAARMAVSYPALLRQAGYRTGFIGKYGVQTQGEGETENAMFDYFSPHSSYPYLKPQPDGSLRHETEICGDKAVEFLNSLPGKEPFCLLVSFNAPHAADWDMEHHYPWPKAVDGMYEDVEIPPPRLADPAICESQPDFLKTSMNRIRWYWRWDTPEKYQKNMRAYFRMVSGIDRVVGRIRDELGRLGLAGNTIIIYMGDNGYYMGDRGFAGKWSHYEEARRVPLIMYDPRRPGKEHGILPRCMALNVDITPTILDLAGVNVPASCQGVSLVSPTRGNRPRAWREDFFCEHRMDHPDIPKWEGVRDTRYVYARYYEQNPVHEFLHDLDTDPDELRNEAHNPAYRDILTGMRARCDELKARYTSAAHGA
ncbi:sulfatase [bacterium]|nr:sulfatase [bacterium]